MFKQMLTINFLEDGNRYRSEIFSVNITFNGLSNDISHFVVAQNFIISTCLSSLSTEKKVLIIFVGCAQKVGNRYEVEIRMTYHSSS